jgi:hypothetical protein
VWLPAANDPGGIDMVDVPPTRNNWPNEESALLSATVPIGLGAPVPPITVTVTVGESVVEMFEAVVTVTPGVNLGTFTEAFAV